MKELYETPEVCIVQFESSDIITASTCTGLWDPSEGNGTEIFG